MVPLSGGRTITNAKVFGAAIGAQRTPAIATSGNVWLRDLVRRRASSEAGRRRPAGCLDRRWWVGALGARPQRGGQDQSAGPAGRATDTPQTGTAKVGVHRAKPPATPGGATQT